MADLIAQVLTKFNVVDDTGLKNLEVVKLPDIPGEDPDELREYIVVVKRDYTIDRLEHDLRRDTAEDDGVDSSMVPDRPVSVANPRMASKRQTHFMMTWAEAQALKNHPEVLDVELMGSLVTQTAATSTQNFQKLPIFSSNAGDATNYALYRCNFTENVYGANTGGEAAFTYNLDGAGVDIVIMDDGVLVDHPEWEDDAGNSRFIQIDWYAAANVAGTMPAGYYDPPAAGHGTGVASIAAGKTYGWARKANIYSLKTLGAGARLLHAEALDLVRQWHENKPTNPQTGFKNPTIVNASWDAINYVMGAGIGGDYDPFVGHVAYPGFSLWSTTYRGNVYDSANIGIATYTMPKTEYALGMTLHSTGYALGAANVTGNLYKIAATDAAINAAVEDLIDAGIVFVHSAGNDQYKTDAPGEIDWNNRASILQTTSPISTVDKYYCRPGTPWANGAIVVGATDVDVFDANTEQRAYFSNYGTAVDLWAPGVGMACAGVAVNQDAYYANASYYQQVQQGTSFSAPCVTGVLALFYQLNPGAAPAEAKRWLTSRAVTANIVYSTGLDNDYANTLSISGAPNRFLRNPYNRASVDIRTSASISNTVPVFETSVNLTRP